jgi:hypothetical protein
MTNTEFVVGILKYCTSSREAPYNLKGQCHEMVVEMSLYSSNLGLDLSSRTLFPFEKRPF